MGEASHRRPLAILAALALLLVALDLALWVRANALRHVDAYWDALATVADPQPAHFVPSMLAGLPAPARRYLRHAIRPGTPLTHAVQLRLRGRVAAEPGGRWHHFSARELLVPGRGYVFRGRMRDGVLPIAWADYYLDGNGGRAVTVLGFLPWSNRHGPARVRANRALLALQSVWHPASLLPRSGVHWRGDDVGHATAQFEIDGRPVSLRLAIAADGRLRSATVEHPRTGPGRAPAMRLAMQVHDEIQVGGYRIPRRVTAGWEPGSARYAATIRPVVLAARFR